MNIIEPLAHSERFGGNVEDAFTVVAPSLPGLGFSERPPRPWGSRRMAKTFNSLMTDVLGYESYKAQDGDWGGAISTWLGFDHAPAPACRTIHINIPAWPQRNYTGHLYNIQQWAVMPRGGHFSAMEEPELLIDDLRQSAKSLLRSSYEC